MKVIFKQTRKSLCFEILTVVTVFGEAIYSCRSVPTFSRVLLCHQGGCNGSSTLTMETVGFSEM